MPENRSATGAASPTWASDRLGQRRFGVGRRLHEAAGRRKQRRAAGIDLRTAVHEDFAAVDRQPGDRLLAGERAQRLLGAAVELAAAVDGDIEPVAGE